MRTPEANRPYRSTRWAAVIVAALSGGLGLAHCHRSPVVQPTPGPATQPPATVEAPGPESEQPIPAPAPTSRSVTVVVNGDFTVRGVVDVGRDRQDIPVAGASVVVYDTRVVGSPTSVPCPCPGSERLTIADISCGCYAAVTKLAEVMAAPPPVVRQVGTAVTAADGTFAVSGLPRDCYAVRAEHADYGIQIEEDTCTYNRPLELTLEEEKSVYGIAYDETTEEPLAGVHIEARHASGLVLATATTGPDGRFVTARVPDGLYKIRASAEGLRAAVGEAWGGEGGGPHDDVDDLEEFWLGPARTLAGSVTHTNGVVAAGARVVLRGPFFNQETRSDAAGRFEFTGLEGGVFYYVVAEQAGLVAGWRVPLDDDVGDIALRLRRVPGSRLSGMVTSSLGAPLHGVRIVVDAGDSWGPDEVMTGPDGRFAYSVLFPGTYELTAQLPGHAMHCTSVEVLEETPTAYDFKLRPAPTLRGTVVALEGKPVRGGGVTFMPTAEVARDAEENANCLSFAPLCGQIDVPIGEDGSFIAEGVGRGELYDIAVKPFDHQALRSKQVVRGDTLSFRLGRLSKLVGRVRKPNGEPLPRAEVSVEPWVRFAVRTDDEGSYDLGTVYPGRYTVSVEDSYRISTYSRAERVIDVAGTGDTVRVDLVAGPLVTLAGTVADLHGRVPPNTRLRIVELELERDRYVDPDEHGFFQFTDIAAGNYTFVAAAPGHLPVVRDVTAGTGKLSIRLQPTSDGKDRKSPRFLEEDYYDRETDTWDDEEYEEEQCQELVELWAGN